MDPKAHDHLRRRIRQIIRERTAGHEVAEKAEGGFLPLAALPMIASALPSVIEAGKRLFGSGKHHAKAKTHSPNHHAMKVKRIMAEHKAKGKPITLAEASKLAKREK